MCACVQVILVLLSAVKVREEVCITDQDRNKLHYETHHYNERLAHSREVTNQRCCSLDSVIRKLRRIDFNQIQAVSVCVCADDLATCL